MVSGQVSASIRDLYIALRSFDIFTCLDLSALLKMTDLLGRKIPNGRDSKWKEKQQPPNGVAKYGDEEPEDPALRDIWVINTLNEYKHSSNLMLPNLTPYFLW